MRDGEEAEEDARKVETRDDTKENDADADSNLSAKMGKVEKPDKQSKANTDNALKKGKLEKSSPQKKKEVIKNDVPEKIQTLGEFMVLNLGRRCAFIRLLPNLTFFLLLLSFMIGYCIRNF